MLLVNITVNVNKPESNGPFLVYEVPDFPAAKDGKEVRGFYILLPIDHRFPDMDEEVNWYSAHVAGGQHVLFKMPAWPYPLQPGIANGDYLYKAIMSQVPVHVQKSMNNAHSVFDPENEDLHDAALLESRKWKYALLDFSKVKDVETLSSKILYADAGDKDALDFDVIDVPLYFNARTKEVTHVQTFLGFKVGMEASGRKVTRTGKEKSKLQKKREEAAAARRTTATAAAESMNQG